MAVRTIPLEAPIDLEATLGLLRRGPRDPTLRFEPGVVWRASRTPDGPVTEALSLKDRSLRVRAWGPGSAWALDHAPILIGSLDDAGSFDPRHPIVAQAHRRQPGLRIPRTDTVFETLVPTILEQKVPSIQAWFAYRRLVEIAGEPAPGPAGLRVPPTPERIAALPSWTYHRLGVERRRAETLKAAAMVAGRLDESAAMAPSAARTRLTLLPGIGPWSAAEVSLRALGDADAVSVGDYHLPHMVAWALCGRPRGTDQLMLELLEPYRGHRGRVLLLLEGVGITAPRFGPRMSLRWIGRD